jgi:hypothetical protein
MSISEALHDAGIKYRHLNLGDQRLLCPECAGGKKKEKSLNLTIKSDGAVWFCHRGTCGNKGGYRDDFNKRDYVGRKSRHQRTNIAADARHLRRSTIW